MRVAGEGGSSTEEKIALIPRLEVWMGSGKKEYAVLLTNERSIFVLLVEKAILVGGLLGAGVGTLIAQVILGFVAPDLSGFDNVAQVIGAVPGAAVGALIADAAARRRSLDWERTEPSALALNRKNIPVPHAALQRLRLAKSGGTYRLRAEYTDPKGKRKKLEFVVLPPRDDVERRKGEGATAKDAAREYAKQLVSDFQRALPSTVAMRAELRL